LVSAAVVVADAVFDGEFVREDNPVSVVGTNLPFVAVGDPAFVRWAMGCLPAGR